MTSVIRIPWYVRRGIEIARDEGIMEAGATLMREITGRFHYQWLKIRYPYGYYLRNIQNSKMYLAVNDRGISRDLLIRGIRERMETRIMQQILKPGMKVIDIGANIGYYVLMEARAVSETGHVYAIEPETKNLQLLRRNIELNGYQNVDVFPGAISDENGSGMLYVSKHLNLHSLLRPVGPMENKYLVEVCRLDDFGQKHHIDPSDINLIRMDVEGCEVKVLAGMTEILRAAKALTLVIEFHPQYIRGIPGYSLESTMEMLAALGFGTIRYATALARGGGTLQFRNVTTSDLLADERVSRDNVFCTFIERA